MTGRQRSDSGGAKRHFGGGGQRFRRRVGGGGGRIHAELIGSEVFNPTTDSTVDKNPKGRARRRITPSCCDKPGIIHDSCRGRAQSEDCQSDRELWKHKCVKKERKQKKKTRRVHTSMNTTLKKRKKKNSNSFM